MSTDANDIPDAAAPSAPPPEQPPPPAPEPPPPALCGNCGTPLLGPFCYQCGQPLKGLIRHFSSILGDFFDTVLSLDSRTFRTLAPLYFRPGFLSNEYFAGRRVRYVTPLRMYFFLSVLAFLVISTITQFKPNIDGNGIHIGPSVSAKQLAKMSPSEREAKLAEIDKLLALIPDASDREKARAELKREIERAQRHAEAKQEADADAAAGVPPKTIAGKDDDDDEKVSFNDHPWDPKTNPVHLDWLSDGLNESLNTEIGELVRKAKGLSKDPGPFLKQIFSVAPQALFLILPLFALLLKIFYIFKRRLYMEHLIVALHSHSFICLSLVVVIALSKLKSWTAALPVLPVLSGIALVCAWIWVFVYLFLMQKRVYRQGWIMSGLKFFAIGSLYLVLLCFGMIATMFVSLVLL